MSKQKSALAYELARLFRNRLAMFTGSIPYTRAL
jgi:hypothetical protein